MRNIMLHFYGLQHNSLFEIDWYCGAVWQVQRNGSEMNKFGLKLQSYKWKELKTDAVCSPEYSCPSNRPDDVIIHTVRR